MNRNPVRCAALAALTLLFLLPQAFGAPLGATRRGTALCYLLVEEGASAEGNDLFLRKMALQSESLSRVAPVHFKVGQRTILSGQSGSFSFESEGPVLVERRGPVALYSVALKYRASPLPRARKTVIVDFSLADLVRSKDMVQPGDRAIELAAAKSGMSAGLAWIVEIRLLSPGEFRAKVALAK